jgi:putative peptidoglycan lipid II flippase
MMTVLLNAMLSVLLVRTRLDYLGLPLATSAAALFNATVLMFLLRGRLQGLEGRRLAGSVVRIAVAGVLMGAVAAGADVLLIRLLPGSAFPAQITRLGLAIGAALLTLTGAAYVLRIREFHHLVDAVARRLRRSAR